MSAAAMILAGGAPGKRFALPNAKIMIHQGSGGFRGTPADIQIAAREILDMTRRMAEIISQHSGQDVDRCCATSTGTGSCRRRRLSSTVSSMPSWSLVDEWEAGFGWQVDEPLRRTSHALAGAGRVWLIDPVDAPGVEGRVRALGEPAGVLQLLDRHNRDCAAWATRLGVPHIRAWQALGDAPFQSLHVRAGRFWREVALFEPVERTLVCADALGTLPFFRARGERIGWHPLIRPLPPRSLATVRPERILVGHGAGLHAGATEALQDALRNGRRRLPAAVWNALRTSLSAASR